MSSKKHAIIVVLGLLLIFGGGGGLLAWPRYQETARVERDIEDLNHKIAVLSGTEEEVDRLVDAIADARYRMNEELRAVPETSDVAGLIRKLSLPVDTVTVHDQTFTAGDSKNALRQDEPSRAMPITVEMKATFDSAYALLSAAESMKRLIRITNVQLEVDPELTKKTGSMIINASIGLEAIYEPPDFEEGI